MILPGWKTFLFNWAVVMATATATYMSGADWSALLGPAGAPIAVALSNIALRFVSNSPIFKAK